MTTPVVMANNRFYSKTRLAATNIVTSHIIFAPTSFTHSEVF